MKLKIPSVGIFNLKRLKRVSMSCYHRIRAHRHLRNLELMSITRSGKSTDFLYLSRSTDTRVKKNTPIKVEVKQLFYSSKSKKVQVLKCTHSKKVKSSSSLLTIFVKGN